MLAKPNYIMKNNLVKIALLGLVTAAFVATPAISRAQDSTTAPAATHGDKPPHQAAHRPGSRPGPLFRCSYGPPRLRPRPSLFRAHWGDEPSGLSSLILTAPSDSRA